MPHLSPSSQNNISALLSRTFSSSSLSSGLNAFNTFVTHIVAPVIAALVRMPPRFDAKVLDGAIRDAIYGRDLQPRSSSQK